MNKRDLHHLTLSSICIAAFLFTACQSGLDSPNRTIKVEAPQTWQAAGTEHQGKVATHWVSTLGSKRLVTLVNEALSKNPNLAATAAAVEASEQSILISRAALLPSIDYDLGGNRSRSESGITSSNSSSSSRLSQGLSASWEADLWGRLSNRQAASYFSYEAALADYRGARLSLAASVSSAYIQLISSEQQVQLSTMTLASFEKNLRIIERNYRGGVPGTRAIDVQFGRSNVSSAQRNLRSRQQSRDEARRALERLLGRYPNAQLGLGDQLPALNAQVPSSLPASLIERRPDLAAARSNLLASAEIAEASQKALLPSLRLSASASASSSEWQRLFDPAFLTSTIASNLTQPIFRGGQLKAEAKRDLARNNAALQSYVGLVLDAFREVEDALAGERYLREQEQFLEQEAQQASLAERQAERDYTEGIEGVDILDLLEAQRRAFNARSSLIALRAERLLNRIRLHRSLGGAI